MNLPSDELLKTALHDLHLALGARMVPFAGYSMPVQYPAGLMAEHHHTRNAASLFDVSHMGQLRLLGPDAAAALGSIAAAVQVSRVGNNPLQAKELLKELNELNYRKQTQ